MRWLSLRANKKKPCGLQSEPLLSLECIQLFTLKTEAFEFESMLIVTHRLVCKSTLPFHCPSTRTPTCSFLCRAVSSKCPQFCTSFHLHGSDLRNVNSLLTTYLFAPNCMRSTKTRHTDPKNSLAMVQLILPLPDPMQVQSQIMPSFGRSYVSPTRYDRWLYLSKQVSSATGSKSAQVKPHSCIILPNPPTPVTVINVRTQLQLLIVRTQLLILG